MCQEGRLGDVPVDPRLQVPTHPIPRLRYPDEIDAVRFEREFAGVSKPCIITGLIDDWPAYADAQRTWRGERWDKFMADLTVDAGFDPVDSRMMHFGDESEEGGPRVLFNPGRLRMPVWAFLECGRLRQLILEAQRRSGGHELDLGKHPGLKERLNKELTVQNMPFLNVDEHTPMHYFSPITCRMRDLLPLSFYLSHDTFALPEALQQDVAPQASKLMPGWGEADSSRIWVTNGGPWKVPYPPWSSDTVPEPGDDPMIYSCFHCDRMENFHSLIAGEKEIVLVPPGQKDVLKSTRFSEQKQWLMAPVSRHGGSSYLRPTLLTSLTQRECTSDQSAVQPLRADQDLNRAVSAGEWPDGVDFPIYAGRLQKGDTLYIPAYHWHFVATATPPVLGLEEDGALAMSVNFWWWPIHNDATMERWSYQNEVQSWQNRRIELPAGQGPASRESHAVSFYRLTAMKRAEAARAKQAADNSIIHKSEFTDAKEAGKGNAAQQSESTDATEVGSCSTSQKSEFTDTKEAGKLGRASDVRECKSDTQDEAGAQARRFAIPDYFEIVD